MPPRPSPTMKRTLLLAVVTAPLFLSACAQDPPPPPVVVHHHHRTRVYRERSSAGTPVDEARGNGSAEGFRAVERPGSYSGQ